jgi:hypothetical protein
MAAACAPGYAARPMRSRSPSSHAWRLRLAGALVAVVAPLVAAALGCGDNIGILSACETPILDEKGADGEPDPCHCDPPSSANFGACPCLSDPNDQQSIAAYQQCMFSYYGELDGGNGGH